MKTLQTMLFMPGNNPGMLISADVLGADAVIFDLEDAVALDEKDAARHLTAGALGTLSRARSVAAVRMNPLDSPYWQDDLHVILPAAPDALIVPKATPDVLADVIGFCRTEALALPALWPLIESPGAIVRLAEFFCLDRQPEALLLGGEDYAAALGVARTADSLELLFARTSLVTHAKANGCLAIDTPFTDITDADGLARHVRTAKTLGFDGVLAIHPAQVQVIRDVFYPTPEEIAWAAAVLKVAEDAAKDGLGVFSYGGKMVDRPVLLRAESIRRRSGGA